MKRLTKKDFNICNVCARGPLGMDWDCDGFPACGEKAAYDRLAAIEDILCDSENEYDLERLAAVYNQRVSMRDEVSQRFSLTAKISLDRLREIAEAERDGRCVVFPRLEPGHGDNPGAPGVPGPPGIATEATLKAREQDGQLYP